MDWRTENNILNGIGDIVSNLKKQHENEINLLNQQHKEVIKGLLKQSQTEQQNHDEAMRKAVAQVKYARRGFYVAFAALIVTIAFNIYMTWFA